ANFSVFSRGATAVDLLLFDREDDPRPVRVIPLDPLANRTYHYWHTFVPGLRPGQAPAAPGRVRCAAQLSGQRNVLMEFKEYDFTRNPVVQNEVFFLQPNC